MDEPLPSGPLVTTAWLAERLHHRTLRVLDATWRMPGDPADPHADFRAAHIPGAQFFDIDVVADRASDLPHMAPSPEEFAAHVQAMGIADGDTVVIYDQQGLFSAARAWWTFRLFGIDRVYVLDGGLPRWRAEARPIEQEEPAAATAEAQLTPRLRSELVRDFDQVRTALDQGAQVVDARGAARFRGDAPEPRAGLRSGHMPGARNLPFDQLISNGALRSSAEIDAAFRAAGVDPDQPVIATCGSGLTAAVLALALARLGHSDAAVYDGSWTEWGGRTDTPVVTGEA